MDSTGHNGFGDIGLDESNFGESSATKIVKAFDAFPKTKPSYTQQTNTGGIWTVVLMVASAWLAFTELGRWWVGTTTHTFSVEQGVGHDLQINLDVVVKMNCQDVHVNVQDASGDRVLAGQTVKKESTAWIQWEGNRRVHALGSTKEERMDLSGYPGGREYKQEDVHDYLGAARRKKQYAKTPRVSRGMQADSCRIFGSLESNKVQGDFHITARGHGYMEYGQHLDHTSFNFSHHINELSFGPFYPSLTNPLDNTVATTENHFHKFQYYLSVVPTVYTTDSKALKKYSDKYHESPSSGMDGLRQHPKQFAKDTVFTNQYAVTEQSHIVPENAVPGLFVKYDIEPIMLTIAEEWSSIPSLFIRLVNVISGILVAGGWLYTMSEWAKEVRARGRRQSRSNTYEGILSPPTPAGGPGDMDKKLGY